MPLLASRKADYSCQPTASAKPETRRRRIYIPASVAITPRVLLGAAKKFADTELGIVIDGLIAELDVRAGDPDLEPLPDDEEDWTA